MASLPKTTSAAFDYQLLTCTIVLSVKCSIIHGPYFFMMGPGLYLLFFMCTCVMRMHNTVFKIALFITGFILGSEVTVRVPGDTKFGKTIN